MDAFLVPLPATTSGSAPENKQFYFLYFVVNMFSTLTPLLLFCGKCTAPPDWQVPSPCLLTEVLFLFHFLYTHSHSFQYTDACILQNVPHPPSFSQNNSEWHRNRSVLCVLFFSQECSAGCRLHQKIH